MTLDPTALPPEQAIKWFESKGFALTFDWRDMWEEHHARSFTVAKVAQLDVLADIREAVDSALRNGDSLGEFKKRLRPTLQAKGWWGEKEQVDPKTGEVRTVQLGSARRLKVIYDTNLRTAHAAGKWQRIEENAARRPYLRYVARRDGDNRRKEHQAFNDIVRPVGDPFWDTHYGPNGWGCQCTVQQLNERDLTRLGLSVSAAPKLKWKRYENERTGAVSRVPEGISPGWGHNVGKARGFEPLDNLPVLEPVRSYADYGAARAQAVKNLPKGPKLPPIASGPDRPQKVLKHFRSTFGTSPSKQSVEIADPTGMQVSFHERLLDHLGPKTDGRERWFEHARETVKDPFEVWLVPHRRKDGSVVLRRRYIGLYQPDTKAKAVLVVVEGNGAITTVPYSRIDRQRQGYLHYAKEGQK